MGTTPLGLVYPDATDPVTGPGANGSTQMQTLAESVDTLLIGPPGLVFVSAGTFTTQASVSLPDDSFDSRFDDYELQVTIEACSATTDTNLTLRLRSGGVDDTSSGYDFSFYRQGSASQSNNSAQNQTAAIINYIQATAYGPYTSFVDLIAPLSASLNASGFVRAICSGYGFADMSTATGGFLLAGATAFDSATFFPASGTISGRWVLCGRRKAA